jgi:hypothetical protein
LDTTKRHQKLDLWDQYCPDRYPNYDNYNAIEVGKVDDIPCDYYGVMGVPITFIDKYCPEQFEIIGCSYQYGDPGCHKDGTPWGCTIADKDIYKRIFIRRIDQPEPTEKGN